MSIFNIMDTINVNELSYIIMNDSKLKFDNNTNKMVMVTAFFNIDREKWNVLNRDVNYYIESLKYY